MASTAVPNASRLCETGKVGGLRTFFLAMSETGRPKRERSDSIDKATYPTTPPEACAAVDDGGLKDSEDD